MKLHSIIRMGLLSLLFGCKPDDPADYAKKGSFWTYKGDTLNVPAGETLTVLSAKFAKSASTVFFLNGLVDSADAPSFVALNESYAKDKSHVYFCDTFRKGQDYYVTKYPRTRIMGRADIATFRALDAKYATDKATAYYEGVQFAVKDVNSFEVLDDNFGRDRLSGYYMRMAIPKSDGSTFRIIAGNYSRDSTHVFYSNFESDPEAHKLMPFSVIVPGADAATFEAVPYVGDGPTAKDRNATYRHEQRIPK